MKSSRSTWAAVLGFGLGLGLATALPAAPRPKLPVEVVEKVRDEHSGGSFTRASTAVIGGKKVFLKSIRGSMRGTRYANFESDLLATALFERFDLKVPGSRVLRLAPGSPLAKDLGSVVLAMEFVDSRFARGRVYNGHWPGREKADVDAFLRMLVLDLLIGNGDRRGANFFVIASYAETEKAERPGSLRPVPIDNNCGFGTMVPWSMPTSQVNFLKTYSGIGTGEVFKDLGTIANLVADSWEYQAMLDEVELHPRLLEIARDTVARLEDDFLESLVAGIPREVVPPRTAIDRPEWLAKLPEETVAALYPMPEGLSGAELFEYRQREIRETLAWRRDHLLEALEPYLATRKTEVETREAEDRAKSGKSGKKAKPADR